MISSAVSRQPNFSKFWVSHTSATPLQCQYLNFINKIDKMTIILRILPLLAVVSSSFANPTSEATSNFIEVKPTTTQIQKSQPSLWTLLTELLQSVVKAFQDFFFLSLRAERSGQASYSKPLFTIPVLDRQVTKHDVEIFLYDALVVAKKFYPGKNDEF